MPTLSTLLTFTLVCFGFAITPGPNMMYLVSRSICQGPRAGLISLAGVAIGFALWMLLAVLGISALLAAVPLAYDTLRIAGAVYLGWLAWTTLKPGGRSPFEVRALPPDSSRKLFAMGFVTNLLNPKAAVLYLSLLPQFIDPARGPIWTQGVVLGAVQIANSAAVNSACILTAGTLARFFARRPGWASVQRVLMGSVLGALALRMAVEARK